MVMGGYKTQLSSVNPPTSCTWRAYFQLWWRIESLTCYQKLPRETRFTKNVVTSIIQVPNFEVFPEQIIKTFNVVKPICESTIPQKVYHDYAFYINQKSSMVNLDLLDMVGFCVILGMD